MDTWSITCSAVGGLAASGTMRYQALPVSPMFTESSTEVAARFLALGKPDAFVGAVMSAVVTSSFCDARSDAD